MFPFEVDPTSDLPLWVQLRNRIAYLINDGTLAPGDKLPTVRGLASEISINYNTVNKAYLSLVSDGILESTRGRGVFVRNDAILDGMQHESEVDTVLDDCIQSCRDLGLSLEDIQRRMIRRLLRQKALSEKPMSQNETALIMRVDMGGETSDTNSNINAGA